MWCTLTPSDRGVLKGKRSVRGAVLATHASVPLPWCTCGKSERARGRRRTGRSRELCCGGWGQEVGTGAHEAAPTTAASER